MINVSNTLKQACNSDKLTYREYVVLSGTTTQIDVMTEMYATAYKDTHFVGSFNMKYIKFTTSNDVQYRNKELTLYKEINGESFKVGSFIVTEIKDNDSDEEVSVTAYDYGLKFAQPYQTNLDYSSGTITVKDVLDEVCTNVGIECVNETITNGNFIVDSNQFVNDEMYGDVISAIAFISGDFATITNDDKLEFVFTKQTNEIIEDYVELEDKRDTRPITSVSIGMSQVEGENIVLKDEDLIEQYGEHWLVINDVPFAYTQAKREQLITAIFNKVKGFGYSSFKSKYSFKPYMALGDLIKFRNKDGNLISSIILEINTKYDDVTLAAPSVTNSSVAYQNPLSAIDIAKRTEIIVNKQEQTITSLTSKTENIEVEVQDINSSITMFSVDLSQYTLTIPTNSMQKPLETRNYDINYYGYYKGKQVVPNVSISGDNEGITTSTTSTYIRFAVDVNSIISNLTNNYTITFTYDSPSGAYTLTKKVSITLSIQGKDGTSVNILGSYNSLEELKQAHPTGNVGDAYIVQGNMYVWSTEENTWVDVGNIQGPKGDKGDDGYTPQKGIDYFDGKDGKDGTSERLFIRYSANSNGNPMTTAPQSNTAYMGTVTTTATTAPTSYTAYTWVKTQGIQGIAGKTGDNGLTPYVHIMYSADGSTFVPEEVDNNGNVVYPLGKKPSAWMGQYVDYNQDDSTNFNDYEWYKFTEDIDEELNDIQQNLSDNTNAISTLKTEVEQTNKSFSVRVTELQTQLTNNSNRIDDVDLKIENGVELVKNKLVTIDINGISVSTDSSAISTLLSNDRFSINSKNGELFFVGYDYELQKTVSRIDNLTVTNYLTSGYHRTEGFEIDGEYRTGDYYIGV